MQLIRIEKNNSFKSYNLFNDREKGLGAQGPRAIFPVKIKILEFCKLI